MQVNYKYYSGNTNKLESTWQAVLNIALYWASWHKASVPLGAWTCNFFAFIGNYDQTTDQPTKRRARGVRRQLPKKKNGSSPDPFPQSWGVIALTPLLSTRSNFQTGGRSRGKTFGEQPNRSLACFFQDVKGE